MPSTHELPPMDMIDLRTIRARFGADVASRGEQYFRDGKVGFLSWHHRSNTITAPVGGSADSPYKAVLQMVMSDGRAVDLQFGYCSCPVGLNCKHLFAVLRQAVHDGSTTLELPVVQHWSHAFSGMRKRSTSPAVDPNRISAPRRLGLQLTLSNDVEQLDYYQLRARPVHTNERGTWVTTGIDWDQLPYSSVPGTAEQIGALRELYSLHQMKAQQRDAFYYNAPATSIDLAAIAGRLFWDVLAEAVDSGLSLLNSRRRLGTVELSAPARFDIDVRGATSEDLSIQGRMFVGSSPLEPKQFGFLAADGSGIVHWDVDASDDPAQRRFALARLDTPLAVSLHKIATAPTALIIPSSERSTFRTDYLPALREDTVVVSSDDSYAEPVIVGPELRVTAAYSAGHTLTIDAEWSYRVDDIELLMQTDNLVSEDGNRSAADEYKILTDVRDILGYGRVQERSVPSFVVREMAAAYFLTHTVPLLRALPHVLVVVTGEPPDFADASAEIVVELSTKSIEGSNDWFDLGVVVTLGGTRIQLAQMITAVAQNHTHLLMSDGRYFDLRSPALLRLRELLDEARALQDSPDAPLRLSRYQAALWDELAALGIVAEQAAAWRAQVSDLLTLGSVDPIATPSGLTATLRTYQTEGLSWLNFLYRHGLGGILADDMGLGKTIQTLALITHVRETSGIKAPFLIVAPSSVVHNWVREAARFAPELTVNSSLRTTAKRGTTVVELANGADIVITSYAVFRLDFDKFADTTWSGLILDEAQYVKNYQGKSYQCARLLSAPFKLAITGTPMENNVMELWALLSITAPGLFPSPKKFTDSYRKPIEKSGNSDVLERLRRRIKPVMLRRNKDIVASDLPPKQEQTVEIELHPTHARLYDTTLNRERQKVLGLIHDLDKNRFMILKSLTLLRQLSLDAGIVDAQYEGIPSAKTDELVAQLTEIGQGGHRALVFSQFTRYLGRVRDRLDHEGIGYEYLDGSTRNRAEVIERFRSGSASVFLISLKAGGVGLTLTEADYCFILDPWWNPATEMQAVDRAHRIGQTKTVFVKRYVTRGTIEEKVMALKERKAKLIQGVLDDGNAFDGGLTADDIRGLLD